MTDYMRELAAALETWRTGQGLGSTGVRMVELHLNDRHDEHPPVHAALQELTTDNLRYMRTTATWSSPATNCDSRPTRLITNQAEELAATVAEVVLDDAASDEVVWVPAYPDSLFRGTGRGNVEAIRFASPDHEALDQDDATLVGNPVRVGVA